MACNSANTAPTISAISAQTINEDANTGAIAFIIGDAETLAGSLVLSATSSNTALVPVANVAFGGSGANRTVTATPVANQFGSTTITVTVADAGGLTQSSSFALTVNPVNDSPTISNIPDQAVNVNTSTGAISFGIGDVETSATNLTLSATSSNTTLVPVANVVFTGSGANRTVTVTPAANQSGTATVTVTVSDANAGSASDSFVLTVSPSSLPTVTVAASDANAAEPSDNGAFTVTRTGSTSAALLVNYQVTGTASSPSDFANIGTSVTIPAGQVSVVVPVTVASDSLVESSETVVLALVSNATYALGSPSSATVTITDAPSSGGLPWAVNFNGLPTGTTSQGAPTSWTATRTGGTFSVSTDRLQINGAGGEGVFTTGLINITGVTVNLSIGVQSAGQLNRPGDYIRLYTRVDGGAETLVNQASGNLTAVTWTKTGVTGGTLQVIIRSAVSASDEFYYIDNLSVSQATAALPGPWVSADIGAVGAVGSATHANSTFTVIGSGADILGAADEFHYVRQPSSGDCSIVAQVLSITNTNAWAKAGVMVRESTAAGAKNFYVFVTPNNGVALTWRKATNGTTNNATPAVPSQTVPKFLKIERTGNSFAAFRSDNGTTWTQVGATQTFTMSSAATLGLAVTSRADGTLCTSTMDNVIATP